MMKLWDSLPRFLIVLGLTLVFIGILITLISRIPYIGRLGHLPGDLIFEGRRYKIYIPIVTSLLLSIILTLLLNLLQRFIR